MTNILKLGHPERHFWLTRSVARVMGLNLSECIHSGHLSAQDYSAMVTHCRTCAHADACERWLARQFNESETGPKDCVNADILCQLRQKTSRRRPS